MTKLKLSLPACDLIALWGQDQTKFMTKFIDPPFDLLCPAISRGPVLFSTPHSGRHYSNHFQAQSRLTLSQLRRSEDAYVDDLYSGVVVRGAHFLRANFPRAFVDVNREPYELDPTMFTSELPSQANTASIRVAGGLGTIPRFVTETDEIYANRIPVTEALERIARLYMPYHQAVRDVLGTLREQYGAAVLIDCHSMPSLKQDAARRADFILGDRYGTSCSGALTSFTQERLRRLGYTVSRNKPYAGGYITETYGHPAQGFHALQIEINRGLYMNERKIQKLPQFAAIQSDILSVSDDLIGFAMDGLNFRQAAE